MSRFSSGLVICVGTVMTAPGVVIAEAQRPAVVPRPARINVRPGEFRITPSTSIVVEPGVAGVRAVGDYLADWLESNTGREMAVREGNEPSPAGGTILLTTVGAAPTLGEEGYELDVGPNEVVLRAPQSRGLFYGIQTLRQLGSVAGEDTGQSSDQGPETLSWPCVHILDKPRYSWRGMLLDCCRHFMTKDFVKRYIDLLAYHKMNVLHWHLTEDQGWRVEIKKYPRLTEVGAWRGEGDERHGGFYTQEDIKEIVAYAAKRYVTIVPEIEMPGHSMAALAAYPELSCAGGPFQVGTRWGVYRDVYCAGNDGTFAFLQDVLAEVIELFPSPFVHIGGDECPKDRWKACAKCQARMKAEGLSDEHELQSYFIRRIETFLNATGRRIIGWDEILEGGLAPNATVQSWRGMSGAIIAAQAGHDVISSPTSHCYLDYAQARRPGEPTRMGFIDLETVYSFEPTPGELDPDKAQHILGAEGNMWTEHAPQQRVDHQVFPRLCALAEVTWSPSALRDWTDFRRRMKKHYERLDALGVTYFVEPPRLASSDTVFTDSLDVTLVHPFEHGEIRFTIDGRDPVMTSPKYVRPLRITDSQVIKARTFLDHGRSSSPVALVFKRQRPRRPVTVERAVPGLQYSYYEGVWDHLPEFDAIHLKVSGYAPVPDFSIRQRDVSFAVRFVGYIDVPDTGAYTFYLTSDDGSRLWLGDELVVNHDGLHSECEQLGQVMLEAGKHPITIAGFQGGGSQILSVSYKGPGITKQPVPASAFWRPATDP